MTTLLIAAMLIDASKLMLQESGADALRLLHSCHVCFCESFGTGDVSMLKVEIVSFVKDS